MYLGDIRSNTRGNHPLAELVGQDYRDEPQIDDGPNAVPPGSPLGKLAPPLSTSSTRAASTSGCQLSRSNAQPSVAAGFVQREQLSPRPCAT